MSSSRCGGCRHRRDRRRNAPRGVCPAIEKGGVSTVKGLPRRWRPAARIGCATVSANTATAGPRRSRPAAPLVPPRLERPLLSADGCAHGRIVHHGSMVADAIPVATVATALPVEWRRYSERRTKRNPCRPNSGSAAAMPSAVSLSGWLTCASTIEPGNCSTSPRSPGTRSTSLRRRPARRS